MDYAIIAWSQFNEGERVALVDRSKTKSIWWTAHDPQLILKIYNRDKASRIAKELTHNAPTVRPYEEVVEVIQDQSDERSRRKKSFQKDW